MMSFMRPLFSYHSCGVIGLSARISSLQLIAQQGDLPMETKTQEFCSEYTSLSLHERECVLQDLASNYSFDRELVRKACELYISLEEVESQPEAAERLRRALQPGYAYALRRIRNTEGGIKFLVGMRRDLLGVLQSSVGGSDSVQRLKCMDGSLRELLDAAFGTGFLQLQRLTWDSPCSIMQKVCEEEAVHQVRSWADARRRVGAYRRCFVFTHGCMPGEPLIVLHTALTDRISDAIGPIVKYNFAMDGNTFAEDPEKIHTAVFYSITSLQKGLQGVDLGHRLIKRAASELRFEFPRLQRFSSLSPVPGFRKWLLHRLLATQPSAPSSLLEMLRPLATGEVAAEQLRIPLVAACAHYLLNEKHRNHALDGVAHFHLRNGAVIWRINWAADLSNKGLTNSFGIMLNYRYYLDETEDNSRNYMENNTIKVSDEIEHLAASFQNIGP